jgi:hypothetical protein
VTVVVLEVVVERRGVVAVAGQGRKEGGMRCVRVLVLCALVSAGEALAHCDVTTMQ